MVANSPRRILKRRSRPSRSRASDFPSGDQQALGPIQPESETRQSAAAQASRARNGHREDDIAGTSFSSERVREEGSGLRPAARGGAVVARESRYEANIGSPSLLGR